MEVWEKVQISAELAKDPYHGKLACTLCHQGREGVLSKGEAHQGLVRDPADGPAPACAASGCHPDAAKRHAASIHGTQQGFMTSLAAREGLAKPSEGMMGAHKAACASCHTSCGQCHISRPHSVKGGFIAGHQFKKRPNQMYNCVACHGSRIGEEFRGQHEGIPPDVHYLKQMTCFDCHSGAEMHGDGTTPPDRYAVTNGPTCLGCHKGLMEAKGIAQHTLHKGKVACQVCHSMPYKNCYGCHVGKEKRGLAHPSRLDFRIARNPLKSTQRPWNYSVVRHVPILPDSFDEWGVTLKGYASAPTWRYASPHNIQKKTPQNADCDACHGKEDLFLTAKSIQALITEGVMVPEEVTANAAVVVDKLP